MFRKILLAILTLALIGVATVIYLWNKPPEKVEDKTGIAITATALTKEFADDEQKANEQYLGKVIEVTGTVMETEPKQDGTLMIMLDAGDPLVGVQCSMREKGITVKSGQNLKIKGFCSGSGLLGVTLTDCIVQNQHPDK